MQSLFANVIALFTPALESEKQNAVALADEELNLAGGGVTVNMTD